MKSFLTTISYIELQIIIVVFYVPFIKESMLDIRPLLKLKDDCPSLAIAPTPTFFLFIFFIFQLACIRLKYVRRYWNSKLEKCFPPCLPQTYTYSQCFTNKKSFICQKHEKFSGTGSYIHCVEHAKTNYNHEKVNSNPLIHILVWIYAINSVYLFENRKWRKNEKSKLKKYSSATFEILSIGDRVKKFSFNLQLSND